jgi:hypothetical protein
LCWAVAGLIAGLTFVAPQALVAATPEVPQVGQASLVVKKVEGTIKKQRRLLVLKDDVFQNEVVETGANSASEIRFIDNTRIAVGPNSKVVLDKFVFDPDPGQGEFVLKVTQGVFRFFSGDMDSTAYRIQTPTLSIGVRGTILVIVTRANGEVAVILESDDGVTIDSESGETVVLDTPGLATIAFIGGGLSDPGPPPAWALWRVHEMDALFASLGLAPEPGNDNDFNPPSPSAIPPGPPDVPPPDPPPDPPPPVVETGRLRALPRAVRNFGGGPLPPGLNLAYGNGTGNGTANFPHAINPGDVPAGGLGGGSSGTTSTTSSGGGGTTAPSSNGLARGIGNGAANGVGAGASNGVGNNNAL